MQNHPFNGNGSTVKNHWKNHWYQWLKCEKPLKTHRQQWFTSKKTIEKPSTTMVLSQKNITIPSWSKIDHRNGLPPSEFSFLCRKQLCKSISMLNSRGKSINGLLYYSQSQNSTSNFWQKLNIHLNNGGTGMNNVLDLKIFILSPVFGQKIYASPSGDVVMKWSCPYQHKELLLECFVPKMEGVGLIPRS